MELKEVDVMEWRGEWRVEGLDRPFSFRFSCNVLAFDAPPLPYPPYPPLYKKYKTLHFNRERKENGRNSWYGV